MLDLLGLRLQRGLRGAAGIAFAGDAVGVDHGDDGRAEALRRSGGGNGGGKHGSGPCRKGFWSSECGSYVEGDKFGIVAFLTDKRLSYIDPEWAPNGEFQLTPMPTDTRGFGLSPR